MIPPSDPKGNGTEQEESALSAQKDAQSEPSARTQNASTPRACEGCGAVATCQDAEDIPLCDDCAKACKDVAQPTYEELVAQVAEFEGKLNAPELLSFRDGAVLEAAHQRERWGSSHDAGKEPQDWFWLVGYLSGKALRAHIDGDTDKALHHTISSAAALANWHAAILGAHNGMRPGISVEKQEQARSVL